MSSNEAYNSWEKDFLEIDKQLRSAEDTNTIYDIDEKNVVFDTEPAGSLVFKPEENQDIPNVNSSSKDNELIKSTAPVSEIQTMTQVSSNDFELTAEAKKNLMIFAAGLGLFLFLKKK